MKLLLIICGLFQTTWVMSQSIPLTESEKADIQFLICEEKLARDVYQFAAEKYQMPVFAHKVQSEENHRTLLTGLLDTIPPISYVYGEFPAGEWSQLFQTLKTDADVSLEKALSTGALIEELDIYDLEKRKGSTTDTAILRIYDVLIAASEQHLRSFLSQLASRSITYLPQYLSAERIQTIKNNESGCGAEGHKCQGSCGKGGC